MAKNSYVIPGAVIVAGVLIAISVSLSGGGGGQSGSVSYTGDDSFGNRNSGVSDNVKVVSAEDHIRGNPDAKVSIIEFSDFQCPFCQRLHPTLTRILDEFPEDVNWVYRHFPLTQIHSRALTAAIASECIAEQGGNDAFWSFADTVFGNQNAIGDDLYTSIVNDLGLDLDQFRSCADSSKYNSSLYIANILVKYSCGIKNMKIKKAPPSG